MRTHPTRVLPPLALLLLATAAPTQQHPPTDDPWRAFTKLTNVHEQEALTQLLATPDDHPLTANLRRLATAADAPPHERSKARTTRRGKRTVEFPHEVEALPRRVEYLFGFGTIVPRDKAAPVATSKHHHDPVLMQQALLGCAPDSDKALAAILQRLDSDTGGDTFATFLQSWRNGDESFYEALDRTSGTKDSVFFFDAMLDDFRGQFGGSHGEPSLKGGLQVAHDALHAAFLSYRQYRGFREAVAWSLVLPPAAKLPARLQRYEAKVEGAYSLRQQVVMAAAALDWDLDALVGAITKAAAPLPKPVWQATHDPYPAWNATFAGLQPKMLERAGSTDAFLQQVESQRTEQATAWRTLAKRCIETAQAATKAH